MALGQVNVVVNADTTTIKGQIRRAFKNAFSSLDNAALGVVASIGLINSAVGVAQAAVGAFGAASAIIFAGLGAAAAGVTAGIVAIGIAAAAQSEKVKEAFKEVGEVAKAAFAEVGEPLIPVLVALAERLPAAILKIQEELAPTIAALAEPLDHFINTVLDMLPQIINVVKPFFEIAAQGVGAIEQAIVLLLPFLQEFSDNLSSTFQDLFEDVEIFATKFGEFLVQLTVFLDRVSAVGSQTFGPFIDFVNETLDLLADIAELFAPLADEAFPALSMILREVGEIFVFMTAVFLEFSDSLPVFLDALHEIVGAFARLLLSIEDILPAVTEIIGDQLAEALRIITPLFRDLVIAVTILLVEIEPLFREIVGFVDDAIPGLVSGLDALFDGFKQLFQAVAANTDFGDALREIGDSLEELGEPAGTAIGIFIEAIRTLADTLEPFLQEAAPVLTEFFEDLGKTLIPALNKLVEPLADGIAEVWPEFERFLEILAPLVAEILPPLIDFLSRLAQGVLRSLADAFRNILPAVQEFLSTNQELDDVLINIITSIIKLVEELVVFAFELGPAGVAVLTIVATFKLWRGVLRTIIRPIGKIVAVLTIIVGAVTAIYRESETLQKIVPPVWDTIKVAIDSAWTVLKAYWDLLGTILDFAITFGAQWAAAILGIEKDWKGVNQTVQGFIKDTEALLLESLAIAKRFFIDHAAEIAGFFKAATTLIIDFILFVLKVLENLASAWNNTFAKIIPGATAIAEDELNTVIDSLEAMKRRVDQIDPARIELKMKTKQARSDLRNFANELAQIPRSVTVNVNTRNAFASLGPGDPIVGGVTAFAHGGPISRGMPALVGEEGPEMFVPKANGMIVPNDKLGGPHISLGPINVTGVGIEDARMTGEMLGQAIVDRLRSVQDQRVLEGIA